MGRKKVEMKRIEDKSSRQVTFSKRRGGLIKKARDLSVLCDVEVALVIFSSRGKLYEFCSGDSVTKILQRYKSHFKAEGRVSRGGREAEMFQSRFASFRTSSELLQIIKRDLEEPYVEQLCVADLVQLEREIDAALTQTKFRKTQLMMESIVALHEKERLLREENKRLLEQIAAMDSSEGNEVNEVMKGSGELANIHVKCHSPWPILRLL